MWNFSFTRSLAIVAQTWPFLVLRLGVVIVSALIFLVMGASGALLGHQLAPALIDSINPWQGAIFGTFGGVGLGMAVLRILREYALYLVKAAHIAVLVRLVDTGRLPDQPQLAYGRGLVAGRFTEASLLFGLDQMIKVVVRAVARLFSGVGMLLPVPGLRVLLQVVHAVIETSITFVDEIILAHNIRNTGQNPFKGAADALVLYTQNGKAMLRNSAWLTLFLSLAGLVLLVCVVGPFALWYYYETGPEQAYALIGAAVALLMIKEVVLEPVAVAALLQAFTEVTAGQQPDPRWRERLDAASPAFTKLGNNGFHMPHDIAPAQPGGGQFA